MQELQGEDIQLSCEPLASGVMIHRFLWGGETFLLDKRERSYYFLYEVNRG